MNLQNKFKIDDNKVEIKTKVKRLIEQQEGKRKKNNNIITDKKNINITTYNIMKNNLLSKTCNNCSHKATNVDYCELYKEIILDVEMYAFGCDDMTDID